MFSPKTPKIAGISENHQKVIAELEQLFVGKVGCYIDFANVKPWSDHLKWHIDLKRLKQFLDSFSQIQGINLYHGTLLGDERSEEWIENTKNYGYTLRTKPVKIMKFSIDASSVATNDPRLLDQFIRRSLLRKYTGETIEFLNQRFAEMNQLGDLFIEDRKCNFDVEIGIDMLIDAEHNTFDTCILWSGDSDFYDPLTKLLENGKRCILFATTGRVAKELNELRKNGLIIFDIRKIRNFICWQRELEKSKGDFTLEAPKP